MPGASHGLVQSSPRDSATVAEGQRGDEPCLGPHSQGGAALGFHPGLCAWGDPRALCLSSASRCAQADTCPHTQDRGEDQRDVRVACSAAADTAVNNVGVLLRRPGGWMVVLGEGSEGGMGVQPSLDYVGFPKASTPWPAPPGGGGSSRHFPPHPTPFGMRNRVPGPALGETVPLEAQEPKDIRRAWSTLDRL